MYRDYQNAKVIADRYGTEILPRARKAYELMLQRYGLILAPFTSALNLQRILFRLETDYIEALANLKVNAVLLDGCLLNGGLEVLSAMDVVEPTSAGGSSIRKSRSSGRLLANMSYSRAVTNVIRADSRYVFRWPSSLPLGRVKPFG
jgi:hypothetical protein